MTGVSLQLLLLLELVLVVALLVRASDRRHGDPGCLVGLAVSIELVGRSDHWGGKFLLMTLIIIALCRNLAHGHKTRHNQVRGGGEWGGMRASERVSERSQAQDGVSYRL